MLKLLATPPPPANTFAVPETDSVKKSYQYTTLDLKPRLEINPIQETINTYGNKNVFSKIKHTFLGTSGKKVWTATLLSKLIVDIGASLTMLPSLNNMLTQNEFGLFTIGSMLYGVIILNYSTWATRMFIDMLTGISYLQKPEAVKPRLAENFLPHITVQIPCRNEPFELITSRSIQSALNLDYPQDKLTIMVVDNSEPGKYEQLAQYCQEHNILFVHREGKDGGKARNLNIGLGLKPMDDGQYYIPQSDLYFLTDADIEFPASILQDSLPEFQQNLRLPFIIFESDDYANENFFNSSLAAVNMVNNQGNVRIEQYGFTTSGGYGLFYNRHAWNTVGGWKEKFVGEDWATGVAIRTASEYFDKGKRLEYVKVIDRTPENLERLKIQQERWAKGGIETLSKLIPALIKAKHVPWNEKIDIVWRFSFYATMAYSSVMLPAVTVVIATLLPVNNISLLTPLIESWRVFIIPLVIAIAFRTIFWATRQNWKLAIKNITRVIPATIAYSGIGLAVMRGIIHGLYDKKKIFNITPKGQNLNENELLRIIQKNWKELLFGTTLLGTSLFLPIQLFFVGIAGICYLVSPFMSLLKTKEKKTPEN